MPVPTTTVTRPLTNAELSARVFGGELLLFPNSAAMKKIVRHTRALLRDVFDMKNPQTAHRRFDDDAFFARTATLQKTFNTPFYKNLFADCLRDIGQNTEALFWDTLGLRIAPPLVSHRGGFRSSINQHRDTWGTAIQSQINWWAPVYPLTKNRTMGFYRGYWNRPLANTTANWSFGEFLAAKKKSQTGKRPTDYPPAPVATEEANEKPQPLIIPPGDLLAFSAAHLHGSIANTTTLTRYSMEIRTVDINDAKNKRGAINVDCDSPQPLTGIFRKIANNEPLRL